MQYAMHLRAGIVDRLSLFFVYVRQRTARSSRMTIIEATINNALSAANPTTTPKNTASTGHSPIKLALDSNGRIIEMSAQNGGKKYTRACKESVKMARTQRPSPPCNPS